MNFVVSNTPVIKKLVCGSTCICRGQSATLTKLYTGVQFEYGRGTSVTHSGHLLAKGGLPWGLLQSIVSTYNPLVVILGNCAPLKQKAKTKKQTPSNPKVDDEHIIQKLKALNPTLIIDATSAITFWLNIAANKILTSKPGSQILAQLTKCKQSLEQDAACEHLPSVIELLKDFLPQASPKFNETPYFLCINCPELSQDCEYSLTDHQLDRFLSICHTGNLLTTSNIAITRASAGTQLAIEQLPLHLISSILFTCNKTCPSKEDFFLLPAKSNSGIASFGIMADSTPVQMHCLQSQATLQTYLNNATKPNGAINIILFPFSPDSTLTENVLNSLSYTNLRLAKIEYLAKQPKLASAFAKLYLKYVFVKQSLPTKDNLPPYIRQLLRTVASQLATESGLSRATASLALQQGYFETSHALERLANSQLNDAADCLRILHQDTSLQVSIYNRMETYNKIINNCKSISDMSKTMGINNVFATSTLIGDHSKQGLEVLTNLCLKLDDYSHSRLIN